jgi:hypothetical protein
MCHAIKWHVDAAIAVHDDFKSHTRADISMGSGAIIAGSTKQKVNSRSSAEAELIGLDDFMSNIMWTRHSLEAQGYDVNDNIVYQDDKSTIQLAEIGRQSIGKRSKHLSIKYFFVTDLINRKQISIKYCPTDGMLADYITKPLAGRKFQQHCSMIMILPPNPRQSPQECVGDSSPANDTFIVPKKKRQIVREPTIGVKYHPRKAANNKTVGRNKSG